MKPETKIAIFRGKKVRRIIYKNEWWFSVVDVRGVLTGSNDPGAYWRKLNLADYLKAGDFVPVSFPNLKPSSRSISIRIPEYLLIRIKEQANELNVPYQSLMKKYLAEGILDDRREFPRLPRQKTH